MVAYMAGYLATEACTLIRVESTRKWLFDKIVNERTVIIPYKLSLAKYGVVTIRSELKRNLTTKNLNW